MGTCIRKVFVHLKLKEKGYNCANTAVFRFLSAVLLSTVSIYQEDSHSWSQEWLRKRYLLSFRSKFSITYLVTSPSQLQKICQIQHVKNACYHLYSNQTCSNSCRNDHDNEYHYCQPRHQKLKLQQHKTRHVYMNKWP